MTTWSAGASRTIDHDVSLALAALAPASLRECLGYKPALSRRHADAPGGASPSGKAPVFGTGIRRFESCRPSQHALDRLGRGLVGDGLMKVLVTGTEGQLARSLAERARLHPEFDLIACGRPELDLELPGSAAKTIAVAAPDIV